MGRVFLALERTATGDHLVVIKRFGNPRSRFTPEQILENQERFVREAEISSALSHPCIARTLRFVQQGPDSYLVQEYVHGMTVDYLVGSLAGDEERIPIPLAVHIATEIARALAYLHDFRNLGLVHRDLTSANVMIARNGEVKVIDFGIAKATLGPDDSLTRPHVLVGKPLWTAPELIAGRKPDRRADLYSLGLILWQLLTGRDPAEQLANGQALPPPSTFNPTVSAACDRLVTRAVHPRPEARFQTAPELLDQLEALLPIDFYGPRQLSEFLVAREGFQKEEFFGELVKGAGALFDVPSMSLSLPTRKSRVLPVSLVLLALVAAGITIGILTRAPTVRTMAVPVPVVKPTLIPSLPDRSSPDSFSPPPPSPSPPSSDTALIASPPPPKPSLPKLAKQSPRLHDYPKDSTPTVKKTPEDLLEDAIAAFSASDSRTALELARASANQRPSAEAYILIGRILFKSDPNAAQTALEKALRLAPDNPQAKRLLESLR